MTKQQNGSGNFTFHQLSAGSTDYPRAGVNQETGKVYTDSLHVDDTSWGTAHSWETNAKYTTNANYIIFRNIDLGGQSDPWTPLMFSGTMYGAVSTDGEKLWNGDGITDSTAITATAETNRPKIKNVYVSTSSSLSLNDYIGVGFFATVQSQANSNEGDLGLRGKKAEVKNLDLQNVTVINNATTATGDASLVSSLLGFTGAALLAAVKALLALLNFNFEQIEQMVLNPQQALNNQLGDMLDARKKDPDVFATGAFAGRVYGNVNIEDCRVMGTVSVTNNSGKGRTGGFVGYITGFTEYSNLSNLLGGTVDLLAGVLNVVPAIGLGDLITIIGDNALPLGQLIAVGYVNPTVNNCTVQGLTGNVGTATAEYAGGFVGEQIGTRITGCKVLNSTFTVSAKDFGGGFSGLTRDADIVGTLGEFGGEFEKELVENIRPQSTLNGSLLSLVEDFVPTIRNSTTSCVPCGGAVRADAASDDGHQRGCAGGYCGHNEGGHIWGLDTHTWQDQNDGVVAGRNFGHNREGEYIGKQHTATAWRIRSVYGQEYAGGFTGFMEAADTAKTGNISLLGGLVKTSNLLSALSVVYPTETNTAVYGPLRNIDEDTWNAWVTYVGKYGGYGMELASLDNEDIAGAQASKYYYGCNVVAGRNAVVDTVGNETVWPCTEGADAGGYVGLMRSGVITNGQSYDMKEIRAMRSSGGYAGSMQTGGVAELGQAGFSLFGLDLSVSLEELVPALGDVFVPTIKSGSVRGWQSGLIVTGSGLDRDNNNDNYFDTNNDVSYRCGYAGGYVGSAYGAQIWGDHNVGIKAGTGCNVSNLRYVRGNNAAGGYAGIATAASVAEVNTHASKSGLLQGILDTVLKNNGDLASVLQATVTKIKKAQVDPDSDSFGFIVEGANSTPPRYAGGFAGVIEAAFVGVNIGDVTKSPAANYESDIVVNGLRSVDAIYYAGGFFGLADVTGVADVSGDSDTNVLGHLLSLGEISAVDAFRPYVYYSEVNGVEEGIIVRVYGENSEAMLGETRHSGCAGGFGGAMMNGTAKYSKATNLNTVYGKNYTGGFIGHMGKSGVVDANNADVADLVGLTAGVLDVFSTHTEGCYVDGIPAGAVIMATGGTEPIAGGFAGYADVSKIKNCHVENLKQVYSDQISGGFVGKTDMHYLISVEANSPLVTGVEGILSLLLHGLLVNDLENIDLLSLNLGIAELRVLTDGDVAYVNLLGLRIGVSLIKDGEGNTTNTALVTIGDSYIVLPYNDNGFVYENDSLRQLSI